MAMKYFAGIGSRDIPNSARSSIWLVAIDLSRLDLGLRSGGADGADTEFAQQFPSERKQIFLPWQHFNGNSSEFYNIPDLAFDIAESVYIHDWHRIRPSVRKLMARNVQQILGPTLTKGDESLFVLCWTKDGCECDEDRQPHTGGTGQAISVASKFDIPVVNMYNDNWKTKLTRILDSEEI